MSGNNDLGYFIIILAGTCIGFLFFNYHPAKIFMGDTGSLALGGAIAGISVMTRTELLLIFIGFIFVIEALSVIIQVASFQLTGKSIQDEPAAPSFRAVRMERSPCSLGLLAC